MLVTNPGTLGMLPAGPLLKDSAIADMLITQYGYSGSDSTFDYFDPGVGISGVCWAYTVVAGVTYICLRGSRTFWDWWKDFQAFANPWDHDTLGPVHPGFEMGMERLCTDILERTKGPRVLAGHSLGAGRIRVLEALMKEKGEPPVLTVCFGEPLAGFQQLADYTADIPTRSYRNTGTSLLMHHDIITDLPALAPPEAYVHRVKLIDVSAEPGLATTMLFGVFRYHHIGLYAAALHAIGA